MATLVRGLQRDCWWLCGYQRSTCLMILWRDGLSVVKDAQDFWKVLQELMSSMTRCNPLSGFDPVRREIARKTMEAPPQSLTDSSSLYWRASREEPFGNWCNRIREWSGEAAAHEIGAPNLHPDLMKIMDDCNSARLTKCPSRHSPAAKLVSFIAGELGEKCNSGAGLVSFTIGKAIDLAQSHVEIWYRARSGTRNIQLWSTPLLATMEM